MRIPSGKIDQNIYFNAVDPLTGAAVTGATSFTVKRSRNGGAFVTYTTPTITEIGSGLYVLLIDEDTTIASTSDSEEYAVYITQASMAPVTRTIELYRSPLASASLNSLADAILDRDMSVGTDSGTTTVRTVRQALRWLRNKWTISGSTLTVYKEDDTTSSWTSTITTNAQQGAVSSSDPAG